MGIVLITKRENPETLTNDVVIVGSGDYEETQTTPSPTSQPPPGRKKTHVSSTNKKDGKTIL